MSVRIVDCANFISKSINSEEEFVAEIEERCRFYYRYCSFDVLLLEEDGVSAEVYHDPRTGFFTSDEFLNGKAVMYERTWCVAEYQDWFGSLQKLAKASSTPIPCSKKIEIAILSLI